MHCQIPNVSLQLLHKTIHTTSSFYLSPKLNLNQHQLASTATTKQTQIQKPDSYNVKFTTLEACQLSISRYPNFDYNAKGGSGFGMASKIAESNDQISVDFDVNGLYIPPLSTATTKFLGLPLPPFLKIDILPETFHGSIDRDSGKVELKFRARFCFSVGTVYKARPLLVDTVLTSEECKGEIIRGGKGERLGKDGMCRLIGTTNQIMHCQIPNLSLQLLHKTTHTTSSFYLSPKLNLNQHQLASTATTKQTQIQKPDSYNVKFTTLEACQLSISRYPNFDYNAKGGSGFGMAAKIAESTDEFSVDFDVNGLYIPPLSTATTKFLGLPLPPFLKIDILPEAFHGSIDRDSGKVELKFRARFCFSVGTVYKARPLLVDTVLTSEECKGKIIRGGKGERLGKDGMCRLVGVAKVEPINDIFMDTFLALPTECLAVLNATISFSSSTT
ncbi:Unknown protein [Striga hermonthica]|uniref:Uncharacterized protein n=1 Tax=Striga hermonthica TaxID=68872 RepID=A0A9N7MK32_STRHE|nr:Unknown protein [Striga hermonthica]